MGPGAWGLRPWSLSGRYTFRAAPPQTVGCRFPIGLFCRSGLQSRSRYQTALMPVCQLLVASLSSIAALSDVAFSERGSGDAP